ncbi:MAG: hypothetical protein ABIG40_02460 [Parcubacteria group bacterium]
MAISALLYSLEGMMCLAVSLKLLGTAWKNRNIIAENFVRLFFFLALAFLSWGIPSLLFPQNSFLLNLFNMIGQSFIFIGFAFGIRSFIIVRFGNILLNFASFGTILMGGLVVYFTAGVFGSVVLNKYGVIEWNLHPAALAIFLSDIIIVSASLAFEFFHNAVKSSEIRRRSIYLGIGTIFSGLGGGLVITPAKWQWLLVGHYSLFLGMALLCVTFFFIPKSKT